MKKDTQFTEMIFRIFKDGQIIALLPYEIADYAGNVTSYMHLGQHSAADYSHVIATTKPATTEQAFELHRELEQVGYSIKVITARHYSKYLTAYRGIGKAAA